MGIFDQIINAIGNPNQQASPSQLATILSTVQQLTNNYGTEPTTVHSLLSVVGKYVGSALQQQNTDGEGQAQAVIDQYGGTSPNIQAVQSLFSPEQQQQVIQDAAQQTGLNPGKIQEMLPTIVPLVLNLLQTGSSQGQMGQGLANPVLSEFLAAAQGGNVNIAEVLQLAGRYLSR